MKRKALKVILTNSFTIQAPSEDELIELATDAGIEGDEPTSEELDDAYESWKEKVIESYEEGEEPPPNGARSDIEVEEID